jgi:DNA-binding beta-propeller fold protein YncE
VGHEPFGMAFDGNNVWVTNSGSNTVQKIPVATGTPGPPITVGRFPDAVVSDGANVWIANGNDNSVQKE